MVFWFSTDALNVPVRISVSGIEPAHCGAEEFDTENTICALNIRKQTSWDDFSKAVSQAVTNHFQAITSDGWRSLEDLSYSSAAESSIGLSASSILSVKLGINIGVRQAKIVGFLEFLKSYEQDKNTFRLLFLLNIRIRKTNTKMKLRRVLA